MSQQQEAHPSNHSGESIRPCQTNPTKVLSFSIPTTLSSRREAEIQGRTSTINTDNTNTTTKKPKLLKKQQAIDNRNNLFTKKPIKEPQETIKLLYKSL